jgi:pimeloyl-ACP methyl ester carboxylesterase
MATATNGSTTLCYETLGSPADPPLLLVMGLGAQLIVWPHGLCELLAERGFFVIRHDNRDCGLSSKSAGAPPDVMPMFFARLTGQPVTASTPYTLSDMAVDALAVLDDLGIDRAHVVGASMGGMIVQTMAIEHPDRLLTATSIMSTPFAPVVGPSTDEATAALLAPPPADRAAYITQSVANSRIFGGSLVDEDATATTAAAHYDRCYHPEGVVFQMAAILASGDRTAALQDVRTPTLVIHGRMDSLVTLPGGEATAAAVPDADLLVFDEMGHDLPAPLWPAMVDAIATNAKRAG